MATVNAQALAAAGLNPTMSSAAPGGDSVDTGDQTFLIVTSGATTANLTITTPDTVSGLAVADRVVAVPANAGTAATAPPLLIPLPRELYGDDDGMAALAWSATTGIKFAVVRL
jgi:hypothetical protein